MSNLFHSVTVTQGENGNVDVELHLDTTEFVASGPASSFNPAALLALFQVLATDIPPIIAALGAVYASKPNPTPIPVPHDPPVPGH